MTYLLEYISNFLCGMLLPALLLVCGIMFFVRLGRFVFSPRFFVSSFRSGGGRGAFSSLWLALGGTLGVGNICGVAAAIYIGGAGCVLWIWVCAVLSAVTKYAEAVLAVKYRQCSTDGCSGGAPYYMKNGLGFKFLPKLFCILCIFTAFTMGNITQVRSAAAFAEAALDIPTLVPALLFGISVFILAAGKGKRISKFTERTVPFLCLFYSALCVIIIVKFRESVPPLTAHIIRDAFTPRAGMGGVVGVLCSPTLRLGVTRGVMSNEAGCGTAPIAYARAAGALPVRSGMLGICEVLVDTLLLCTLTAYALLLPNTALAENSAVSIITAFSSALGGFTASALAASVFLFALASASAWAFYASESAAFLGNGKLFSALFPILYALCAFAGCFMQENVVWLLADISVAGMAVINIFAVILLFPKIKKVTVQAYKNQDILK